MGQETIARAPKNAMCAGTVTAGQEYGIKRWESNDLFVIEINGKDLFCLVKKCAHLGFKNWILK